MGGKNPTLVLRDADLDLAATLCVRAGFGLTGQACTATSRAIVERAVLEALSRNSWLRPARFKWGAGWLKEPEWARRSMKPSWKPIWTTSASRARRAPRLVCGSQRLTDEDRAHGWFINRRFFTGVTPSMRIAREEFSGR
ncbi:MAG: aldehyde dehydrogenase family protein [Verrucomicrobiales bacterium]|nr:aldehyde dehydrogenase family protein [Verrucomicrobiales bacterium]